MPITPFRASSTEGHGGPESYEALFISALIEEGDFTPERWGVSVEDLDCWEQLYSFCTNHQASAGRAPSVDVIKRKYPEFEITSDVPPEWAAQELKREAQSRLIRSTMREAGTLLNEGDGDGARALLAALPSTSTVLRKPPAMGFDHTTLDDVFETAKVPVPWPTLISSNGGIAEGELWLMGGRLAMGKTNCATAMVARAAEEGYKVLYHSLEMPSAKILHRVRRSLCHRDRRLLSKLDGDRFEYKEALDELAAKTPGSFAVMDPSHGRCTNTELEMDLADYDLVVVDHMGLMRDPRGRRAVEDWRVQAEISNRVRESVLRTRGRLIGLVQINRAGASMDPMTTPKSSEIAGADDLGRDADVIITMQRFCKHVRRYSTEKNRDQEQVTWFSKFFPAIGDYTECNLEQAQTQAEIDDVQHER
jgi:hypothetical protein